jgi:rare lipoprotein A
MMRPSFMLRKTRRVQMAAGALTLLIPASAYALSAGSTNALAGPAGTQPAPRFTLARHQIGYGQRVAVTGTAPVSDAGRQLALQFSGAGRNWHDIASAKIGSAGRFRFDAPLSRSGLVRIAGRDLVAAARSGTATPTGIAPSAPKVVRVAARFAIAARPINALGGQTVHVRGHLLPGSAHRLVRLQEHSGGGWRTIASARTGRWGGFKLRYVAGATGQHKLRVRFGGDRANARIKVGAGVLTVYRPSVASWYSDGGSTACGFHAFYGVANKVLPCGTKVTFALNGHSVPATVDDRGPFVGGREWDLNQNTAAALGFGGVGTVWSSI